MWVSGVKLTLISPIQPSGTWIAFPPHNGERFSSTSPPHTRLHSDRMSGQSQPHTAPIMTTTHSHRNRSVSDSIRPRSARVSIRWMAACTAFSMGLIVLSTSDAVIGASRAASEQADRQLSERLVGQWKTRSWGEQVLTNNPDGTASLDVALNRLAAIRYGREMALSLEWTVEEGILRHNLVSGSPQRTVDRLIRDFGASTDYRVVEVTDTTLVLEEVDNPEKQHVWEAVVDDAA